MNAYSSFTQSSPRCPSMGKYLNKLWYNQYYGIGLDNEKETPSDACNNLGQSPENDAEKNPIQKTFYVVQVHFYNILEVISYRNAGQKKKEKKCRTVTC